jgi:hypothetical protein
MKKPFFIDGIGRATSSDGVVLHKTNSGISFINELSSTTSEKFILRQNYPNPFNPTTKITFSIPSAFFASRLVVMEGSYPNVLIGDPQNNGVGLARLSVFDISGREVETLVNEQLSPGTYSVTWNASAFSSGIYFYTLTVGNFKETKRMILIK